MKLSSVNSIVVVLCLANILSYVFRGVVPAAPIEFQAFIQRTLDVPPDSASFYFGLLESVFIGTYSIAVVVVGYLSKTVRPFRLLSIGLVLWCMAVVLCGLAYHADSFNVLLTGRILSGIGDSCIQALTPPFIERYTAKERRNLWMGLYYGGVAIGTGLAYFYGSIVTRALGWHWAFYICSIIMAPIVALCTWCIRDEWNVPLDEDSAMSSTLSLFFCDFKSVFKSAVFLLSSLGGAAYAFTLTGLATFAPAILIGAGTFPANWSSTIFGLFVVITGVVGSPLGGILMDRACRGREHDEEFRLIIACRQQLIHVVIGMPFLLVTTWCLQKPALFLISLAIGLTSTFGTFSATTVSVLLSVPPSLRGLAIGIFTTIIHGAGDVPAPMVVGLVKDWYAPGCGSTRSPTGQDIMSPACFTDSNRSGLQLTLFWNALWLGWAVLTWLVTWRLALHSTKSGHVEVSTPEVAA